MNKEYIVTVKMGCSNQRFKNLASRYNATIDEDYRGLERMFKITMDDMKKTKLKTEREIEHVAPADAIVEFKAIQNIAVSRYGFGDNWGLSRITHGDEWNDSNWYPFNGKYEYNRTGKNVDVYIVDTGCNFSHNDFQGRAVPIFDYYAKKGQTGYGFDQQGHGTHVASTVGGVKYGVAKECNLLISKVFETGGASLAAIVSGIDACLKHHRNKRAQGNMNPSIMNLSLGGPAHKTEEQVVNDCINAGIICVVAAGNDGRDLAEVGYDVMPAEVARAVTVGSHDIKDRISSFSNYGKTVDVFAPGHYICAAGKDGVDSENMLSGTSMASPHVAGACALYAQGMETTANAKDVEHVHEWVVNSSIKDTLALHSRATQTSANRALYVDLEPIIEKAKPEPVVEEITVVDVKTEYKTLSTVVSEGDPITVTTFEDKEQETEQSDGSILWELVRFYKHVTTIKISTIITKAWVTTTKYSDGTIGVKQGEPFEGITIKDDVSVSHSHEVIDSKLTPILEKELKETGRFVNLEKIENIQVLDPIRQETHVEQRTETHTHDNGDVHTVVYEDHHFQIKTETVTTLTTWTVTTIKWSDGSQTTELGEKKTTTESSFNITTEIETEKMSDTIVPVPEESVPDTGYRPVRGDKYPGYPVPFRWVRLVVIVRKKATSDEIERLMDLAYDIAYSDSRGEMTTAFIEFRTLFNTIRRR